MVNILVAIALLPLFVACSGSSGGSAPASAPSTRVAASAVPAAAASSAAPVAFTTDAACDTLASLFRSLFGPARRDSSHTVPDREERQVAGCRVQSRWVTPGGKDPATAAVVSLTQRGWEVDHYYGGEDDGSFKFLGVTRGSVFCRVRHDVSLAYFKAIPEGRLPQGGPDSVAYDVKGDCMRDTAAAAH